jgi:glycosyltransferase involved in cell wall biosynthesis
VALVHDWLTGSRGGEKALEALCDLYPDAPIYTLVHVPGSVSKQIESHRILTSALQHAPFVKKFYRNYLPFFPALIEQFDLRKYDLIISSSHCVAKGVIPSDKAYHACYCFTPMRYIWSHYDDYFGDHRTGFPKRQILPIVSRRLRAWDVASSDRVNDFVAISQCVAERIRRFYGRESTVIYPPVDVNFYTPSEERRQDYYLVVSALVPYKRIEVAIEAFNRRKSRLVIVGTGPEMARLKKLASPCIEFAGRVEAEALRDLYRTARGLIHPGQEDFGISMVEALACGCPVISYAAGGALEIVTEEETGLFFNELTVASLLETVDKADGFSFNKNSMRRTSMRFSLDHFKVEFQTLVQNRFRLDQHASRQK